MKTKTQILKMLLAKEYVYDRISSKENPVQYSILNIQILLLRDILNLQ